MMVGANPEKIDKIVDLILARLAQEHPEIKEETNIFPTVDQAVEAAKFAQKQLKALSFEKREEIIRSIRQAIRENARLLAEEAVKETGMGRVEDKYVKHLLVAEKTPGTEDLKPHAFTGDSGLTLVEMGPYGVIGSITPTTNPVATLLNNTIGFIAAGNAAVFSVHPKSRTVSHLTLNILNQAIIKAGGPANLVTSVSKPSLENTEKMLSHPDINMLVATGGPEIVRKVMSSGKKAIGAGAGNPPVVVDETADLENAAKSIVAGASFDNNLPCIAEKQIIVVDYVAEQLKQYMLQNGAYEIKGELIQKLKEKIFIPGLNKDYIGKDAKVILKEIDIEADDSVKLIICETGADHPFVMEEMMMPVIPLVRVKNINEAIQLAVKTEHGNRHTAIMHSKNVDNLTRLAREIDTTIFVKNGPSYAGIGAGGEGYTTFTIAGPTGEGLTSAKSFCRVRKCVLVDGFSIV